jgi:hypothetical protein
MLAEPLVCRHRDKTAHDVAIQPVTVHGVTIGKVVKSLDDFPNVEKPTHARRR